MADTAKVTIKELGEKRLKAWFIKFGDAPGEWVPFSVIKSYLPATKTITIATWWLKHRGIPFKI